MNQIWKSLKFPDVFLLTSYYDEVNLVTEEIFGLDNIIGKGGRT
ncbi:hypothetical protein G3A_23785 [Bacillus sp. 17376]|nr:hypothetical protein G3A_23785 [Bacillus sp. 17376]